MIWQFTHLDFVNMLDYSFYSIPGVWAMGCGLSYSEVGKCYPWAERFASTGSMFRRKSRTKNVVRDKYELDVRITFISVPFALIVDVGPAVGGISVDVALVAVPYFAKQTSR